VLLQTEILTIHAIFSPTGQILLENQHLEKIAALFLNGG